MSNLITTGIWYENGNLIERRSCDVAPTLEHTKALRSVGAVGSSEFRHAASIPPVIVEQYMAEKGIDMHELQVNPVHWKNILNDPALAGFRIWQGRV
jgi:hypothetical protein